MGDVGGVITIFIAILFYNFLRALHLKKSTKKLKMIYSLKITMKKFHFLARKLFI
jgi:hypothetical protein